MTNSFFYLFLRIWLRSHMSLDSKQLVSTYVCIINASQLCWTFWTMDTELKVVSCEFKVNFLAEHWTLHGSMEGYLHMFFLSSLLRWLRQLPRWVGRRLTAFNIVPESYLRTNQWGIIDPAIFFAVIKENSSFDWEKKVVLTS